MSEQTQQEEAPKTQQINIGVALANLKTAADQAKLSLAEHQQVANDYAILEAVLADYLRLKADETALFAKAAEEKAAKEGAKPTLAPVPPKKEETTATEEETVKPPTLAPETSKNEE
jgi:hypothetical protein